MLEAAVSPEDDVEVRVDSRVEVSVLSASPMPLPKRQRFSRRLTFETPPRGKKRRLEEEQEEEKELSLIHI